MAWGFDPGRSDQVPGRPDLTSSSGEKIQVDLRPEDFPGRPEVQLVKFPTSTSLIGQPNKQQGKLYIDVKFISLPRYPM